MSNLSKNQYYLALGTRPGISTSNSTGKPRNPLKRSKVTWVMCWTLVGHPISMWWTVEITSSGRSTRQATMDFLKADKRRATTESWFCSSSVALAPFAPFTPPQPPPFVTITSPVIVIFNDAISDSERNRPLSLFLFPHFLCPLPQEWVLSRQVLKFRGWACLPCLMGFVGLHWIEN